MLKNGPVLALNLLKVDDSLEGPDQVNYAAMSLDAGAPNPRVANPGKKYGEYDYQAEGIDSKLYDTKAGDIIPYVGKTPFSSLFDRSRFWVPSKINLQAVAANGLGTNDYTTYEHTNLLNFANTGTDEISILVYKPDGLKGYDITAKEWWGGDENIPYGWIRPSDYISDYFIRVVAVKGNWTNYPILSNDPIWSKYFDKNGIIKDRVGQFCSAEGITFIGSWTGIIIPDFVDKQGNYLYIESKVNSVTERTGLMMALNEDAFQNISYDKNGVDIETGETTGKGCWIYDFDANAEGESELGESGVVLLFTAKCKEADYYQCSRDLNRQVKIMFDDNGIEIPFNQVVIHQEDGTEDKSPKPTKKEIKKAEDFNEEQKELSKDINEE